MSCSRFVVNGITLIDTNGVSLDKQQTVNTLNKIFQKKKFSLQFFEHGGFK
jgi:hypothetical protein